MSLTAVTFQFREISQGLESAKECSTWELTCVLISKIAKVTKMQLLESNFGFAGKIISETRWSKNISEKWSEFYRQKCRAGVRTKLLFLATVDVWPQFYAAENHVK